MRLPLVCLCLQDCPGVTQHRKRQPSPLTPPGMTAGTAAVTIFPPTSADLHGPRVARGRKAQWGPLTFPTLNLLLDVPMGLESSLRTAYQITIPRTYICMQAKKKKSNQSEETKASVTVITAHGGFQLELGSEHSNQNCVLKVDSLYSSLSPLKAFCGVSCCGCV